jgi:hypothetical protein
MLQIKLSESCVDCFCLNSALYIMMILTMDDKTKILNCKIRKGMGLIPHQLNLHVLHYFGDSAIFTSGNMETKHSHYTISKCFFAVSNTTASSDRSSRSNSPKQKDGVCRSAAPQDQDHERRCENNDFQSTIRSGNLKPTSLVSAP